MSLGFKVPPKRKIVFTTETEESWFDSKRGPRPLCRVYGDSTAGVEDLGGTGEERGGCDNRNK